MSRRVRLIIAYAFLVIFVITYVVTTTVTYDLNIKQQTYESDIAEDKQVIENNDVTLSTYSSREKIMDEYPNLKTRDNIYYLE